MNLSHSNDLSTPARQPFKQALEAPYDQLLQYIERCQMTFVSSSDKINIIAYIWGALFEPRNKQTGGMVWKNGMHLLWHNKSVC